jgi:hypothetical protein
MRSNPHYLTRHERNIIVIALREKARRQADIAANLSEPATPARPDSPAPTRAALPRPSVSLP